MTERDEHDAYRDHWLALPVRLFGNDRTPDQPPVTIELRAGAAPITVETREGKVHTRPGAADNPDLILTGEPQLVVGLLTGQLSLTTARARGLRTQGNPKNPRAAAAGGRERKKIEPTGVLGSMR